MIDVFINLISGKTPVPKNILYALPTDAYLCIPFQAARLSLHQLREFCVNLVK
jgi:hypothetical protein